MNLRKDHYSAAGTRPLNRGVLPQLATRVYRTSLLWRAREPLTGGAALGSSPRARARQRTTTELFADE